MSTMHPFWKEYDLPAMRAESHFGDRIVQCFAQRSRSVYELLGSAAERFPDHVALVFEGQRWTYRDLERKVERAAQSLIDLGVRRGDRVALLISNRLEFVQAYFACQRLGAITVPVSIREQAAGLAYVLAQCSASLLLFDEALADRVPSDVALEQAWYGSAAPEMSARAARALPSKLSVEDWLRKQAKASLDDRKASPDQGESEPNVALEPGALNGYRNILPEDTAVILYTSGTTGRPKGAMLTHFNIAHSVLHFVYCSRWTDQSRSIMAVPASHVTGLIANISTAVGAGACTIIMPAFRASDYLKLAAAEGLTHTILVPAMYNLCLLDPDFEKYDLSKWQFGGYGGAPMPVATIDALAKKVPSLGLQNTYGATETTSPTTMIPPQYTRDHLDSIGVPLPCAEVKIMDDAGCEVSSGETGEIWIGGPMVVKGYWNNPEATAKEFTAGFWHSGDLGSIDEQGFVRIFDRKKDMLNRGGFKIYSVEVENLMMSFPGVLEAAVVGKPCPVLGERVHAFVYAELPLNGTAGLDAQALRDFCAAHLADYKVPESIVIESQPLPRNPNGKLMKRSMREKLLVND
jgi:long-chain acyl-CoA synthetase